ncbi:MAG: ammonium transporter [Candidatus Omnitrophica bacterium]|nr:ammonium transporter [Candidatus Omnitrophota bacterium]
MMINSGDTAWVLIATALVMLMTIPGLALFYGGLVRRKNVLATMMQSFFVLCLISLQWILFGYSLSFGPDKWHLIGNLSWFGLNGVGASPNATYAATIPHILFMAFQMMFAVITPGLITGAFAERMKFSTYVVFTLLWATLVYNPVCHWIWGAGGWLGKMGVMDFAGGLVVHVTAGFSALVCALYMGSRRGYGKEPMPPHNLPLTIIGAGLLWFGWFGFNAGSALGANAVAATTFVVTNTAAATAALTWMLIEWKITGKPTLLGGATGAVAGLATITPASGFVSPISAIIIGIAASLICYFSVAVVKLKFSYDDSLDAFGVHGIGGLVGVIFTGALAQKILNPAGNNGLFFGNVPQLGIQAFGSLIVIIYSVGMTFAMLKILDLTMGLRVSDEEEVIGLDITQHEESAYTLLD